MRKGKHERVVRKYKFSVHPTANWQDRTCRSLDAVLFAMAFTLVVLGDKTSQKSPLPIKIPGFLIKLNRNGVSLHCVRNPGFLLEGGGSSWNYSC